jgi:hypothetical protein
MEFDMSPEVDAYRVVLERILKYLANQLITGGN